MKKLLLCTSSLWSSNGNKRRKFNMS